MSKPQRIDVYEWRLARAVEGWIFSHRSWVIGLFLAATLFMGWSATKIHIDAGFSKLLPLQHEYMQTFVKHRDQFGGANRIIIALVARDGNIFTPEFFEALRKSTDEVFFIPGVDRAQVQSIFTPNVRFTEVVEDGIAAGNVVPAAFEPTPEGLEQVRENILKAGIVGRLVANDFSGAIISAQLLEFNPNTGEPLDYVFVARELEEKIRAADGENVDIIVDTHIIGFAKVIGDISDGALRVVTFFGIAFLVSAILLYVYTQAFRHTLLILLCSLIAVIWQLGILTLLGFGIDPMGILVPFLVFAIAVSHGVQMVSAARAEIFLGGDVLSATRNGCRQLIIPGAVALASDTVGFITILLIKIQVIREMAITASLGVATVILTNLVLLPVLISYVDPGPTFRDRLRQRAHKLAPIWESLSRVARPLPAVTIIGIAVVLALFGVWKGSDVRIGDLHAGVPELREDSRYNVDTRIISERFSIGVDLISVIVETIEEGCIDYEVMTHIDDFVWRLRNVEGVRSVISLPTVARVINSGWNEGSLKWR
ncbi:MAG: MMPL family transporter, partial [Deltaproteobacteria bacterium]|nr:MMPL family transporter [Deltaproteobacteria bacterium]